MIADEPADLEIVDELGLVIVEELLAASALASGLEIKKKTFNFIWTVYFVRNSP